MILRSLFIYWVFRRTEVSGRHYRNYRFIIIDDVVVDVGRPTTNKFDLYDEYLNIYKFIVSRCGSDIGAQAPHACAGSLYVCVWG